MVDFFFGPSPLRDKAVSLGSSFMLAGARHHPPRFRVLDHLVSGVL